MRSLITGVNGFVGGYLARYLTASGRQVAGVTRDGVAREPVQPLPAWDVARPHSAELLSAVAAFRPDVVFHLAGVSNPGACGRDEPTPEAWAANVIGTQHVLALVRALEPRPRLIFAGTSHVYAPTNDGQVTEESPLGPSNGYGKTKAAAEKLLRTAAEEDGLEMVIARIFHQTGPGQQAPFLFGELIQQIADPVRKSLELKTLDFTLQAGDVRDLCRALVGLAERGRSGEVYNIAGDTSRTGAEWLELIRRGTGTAKPLVVGSGAGRINPAADCDKLMRDTSIRAEIPPEITFRDMLAAELQRRRRL